jgi:hypothetical protein
MRRMDNTSKRWGVGGMAQDDAICFFGREHDVRRIEEALGKKESMMISGPADIGKTSLMKHVLRGLPQNVASRCLYLANFKDLRDLLRKLLTALYQARNPALRRQLHAEGVSSANFEVWLKAKPSPQLKGALYRSVEHSDYRVILDHVPPLTYGVAKVIKELFWMRDTPVFLLVRDNPEDRIDQFSHFFYWGRRQRLLLAPLSKPVAGEVLERCIRRFGLAHLDLDEFREEVLELSGCAPGAIVKMCAMAADKRYQFGLRIKTKLIHIDYLMSGSSVAPPVGRRES